MLSIRSYGSCSIFETQFLLHWEKILFIVNNAFFEYGEINIYLTMSYISYIRRN